MEEIILIKLGEIVLKGLNRRSFEDTLIKNLRNRLSKAGKFNIKRNSMIGMKARQTVGSWCAMSPN